MAQQVELGVRNRNPDVLTSIANLSNDEVFTPPEFANRMLDTLADAWAESNYGASIWEDPNVTFLDPFTKSGVFLREITKRLVDGLERQIPDLQTRVDHVLGKQVFGIAITELTALLARRSVYCSKHANGKHSIAKVFDTEAGNIWFERGEHSWAGSKCRFCGANKSDYDRENAETYAYPFLHTDDVQAFITSKFGDDMKFDVVIGNPPYQLGQSGGDSVGGFAMPIYQKFIAAAKSLEPRMISMVTPSRWFAGGRGLDEFRAEMLQDRRLRELVDFPDASDAFPGTQIKGGVSYFVWDSAWNGDCLVSTVEGGMESSPPMARDLSEFDVLVRRNEAISILKKVESKRKARGLGRLSDRVSPIQPFSLRTSFRGSESPAGISDPVVVFQNGGLGYMSRSEVPRNTDWIDDWKVLVGAAYGAGESVPHQIFNVPIIAGPGTVCTETYLVLNRFSSEVEAQQFALYLSSRIVRFLVSLRKNTQHLFNERFAFVPDFKTFEISSDEELVEFFDISSGEWAFIESMIRPMEVEIAE